MITSKDYEDPYTKYIVHVPSRLADDSREIQTQTIATEVNIAEMKQIVENALAMKQTISTVDPEAAACSTPPMDRYQPP